MLLDKTLYSYNDIMVKPAKVSYIEHRDECNVYKENGKLPIFTAPMSSVVDEFNYHLFESNKINAILPRNIDITVRYCNSCSGGWSAYSLHEFYECFCNEYGKFNSPAKALIDIANGHMNLMYDYVMKAKEIHGDNIIVMVGNIANPETYKVAYNAGVQYIRVGIGSGGCCITSSNTSIHYPMASLINDVFQVKQSLQLIADSTGKKLPYIIADGGIRNYSDVIKALALGADYVMIGSLFASLHESCAKTIKVDGVKCKEIYGMASKQGQIAINGKKTKTAEGITKYLPITTHLNTWVENMESYIRSAMSYTNVTDIDHFCPEFVDCVVISKNTQESVNK